MQRSDKGGAEQGLLQRLNRNQWLVISGVVMLAAFACVAWLDLPLAKYMRSLDPQTRAMVEPITELGKSHWWLIPTALLVGFWSYCGYWLIANRTALVFCSIAGAGLIVHLFKFLFGRARPKLYFNGGQYGYEFFKLGYDYSSFPSGHSTVAGALAASVWLVSPNWLRWPTLVLSLMIAASRVVLTSHWLGDTLAGYLLGVVFSVFLYQRFVFRGWLDEPVGLFKRSRMV